MSENENQSIKSSARSVAKSTKKQAKSSRKTVKKPNTSKTKKKTKQTWLDKIKSKLQKKKKRSHKKTKLIVTKELILAITTIVIGIVAIIGTSYAVFSTMVKGNEEHSVIAGTFDVTFTEGSSIVLDNAYPISDTKGMETTPYTFTIENTGSVDAMYRVRLEEDNSDPSKKVASDKIKISYKKGSGSYSTPQLVSTLEDGLIIETDQSLDVGESASYEIKMWVDESAGNEIQGKVYKTKIVVEAVQALEADYTDTIPPVITLNGSDTINLTKGSTYSESGVASVQDDQDGSIATSRVTRSYQYYNGSTLTNVSSVNTNNVGVYYIYYKVKDNHNNEGLAVRTVNVNQVDTTPPTLTLSGSTSMSLYELRTYTEPGYSATDATDGSLTNRVVVIGTPNMNKAGVYVIKYIVTDDSGNITSKTRTVTVKSAIAAEVVKTNLSSGSVNTTDSAQTFITGTNPNNYIWYSGKLWRAVSIDTSDNSVKMVTQWPQTSINYNSSGNTVFEGSYADQWLNDTEEDGFLGSLRDYENFIKTDSKWNATQTTSTGKPSNTTMVTRPVGLITAYEFTKSYSGASASTGYLNDKLYWYLLTPYSTSSVRYVTTSSLTYGSPSGSAYGIRPAVNLRPSIKISGGSGTESDPYRLQGDDVKPASGTSLNTRYSGEYVTFNGTKYRIVDTSYSTTTKITKEEPLTTTRAFDSSSTTTVQFTTSSSTNIGYYLNTTWYNTLSSTWKNMMTTGPWYRGTVGSGSHYLLSKCTTTACTSKVSAIYARIGLPRYGELLSSQFDQYSSNKNYWTLTPYSTTNLRYVYTYGYASTSSPTTSSSRYIRPSIYLTSSVKISGGSGTPNDPFTLTR